MAVEWSKVPEEIVDLAGEIIEAYHPDLTEAAIGFLFRSEAGDSLGREIWGQAQKVPAKLSPLLDLDFLIWIAKDIWYSLSNHQKRALIDHELCHCKVDGDKTSMRGHDVEEFREIIERYGLWRPDLRLFGATCQQALQEPLPGFEPLPRRGGVVAVEPEVLELA